MREETTDFEIASLKIGKKIGGRLWNMVHV